MANAVWNMLKVGAKTVWKKGAKFFAGAYTGYEAHELIENINQKKIAESPQGMVYPHPQSSSDQTGSNDFGSNEIILILLASIVILLLLILLVIGGAKMISFIAKRAVDRRDERANM